ncbi:hypothetical protein CLOSTMETH_00307 [[Clostridium] methylpentosum DSM 5476]|uniref:Uncharacterized protein n=1 Tax=[Clostridium] methylpentosum DSM 5476 TaxID=537013 RepID=C0E912_9FIRM|nr:hypothetical protein CLOSTMETH_00307 [[Clostridium] methylpentosum DSM 5476]
MHEKKTAVAADETAAFLLLKSTAVLARDVAVELGGHRKFLFVCPLLSSPV